MTDVELAALTALVNHETMLMDAENRWRERNGNAVAYGDSCQSDNYNRLQAELTRRQPKQESKP